MKNKIKHLEDLLQFYEFIQSYLNWTHVFCASFIDERTSYITHARLNRFKCSCTKTHSSLSPRITEVKSFILFTIPGGIKITLSKSQIYNEFREVICAGKKNPEHQYAPFPPLTPISSKKFRNFRLLSEEKKKCVRGK